MTLPPIQNQSNRAQILDEQFLNFVKSDLPFKTTPSSVFQHDSNVMMTKEQFLDCFESQIYSRQLDFAARWLRSTGDGHYTIASCGHEGNVLLGQCLNLEDILFLHYRSGALMIQRSKKLPGSSPLFDHISSLVACTLEPISGGRHKVFGSFNLNVPPQTSTISSHLPKALGAALSIPKAHSLNLPDRKLAASAISMVSFGDASLNHSTAQGAINSAAWCAAQNIPLPLLFVCEDNGIGISVPTPQNWVHETLSCRPHLKYFYANGLNLLEAYPVVNEAINYVRTLKRPAVLHLKTVRPLGHAGSDIETTYLELKDIQKQEAQDPLLISAQIALKNNWLTQNEILSLYESTRERTKRIGEILKKAPKLTSAAQVRFPVVPPPTSHLPPKTITTTQTERQEAFGNEWNQITKGTKTHLAKHINWALTDIMLDYPEVVVFGEDVAKKGGVYNVTTNLWKRFGPKRVFNSLLDEQTILGTAIGLAHNGFLPIPEIQFLAYLHNAEDQIRGEASTLSFFSQGQFTNPMVVRIAGLAYQKGFGGHFHNDNSWAVLRDIPGIIVAIPSRGDDAALMLRSAVEEAYERRRVVIFIEPIALYMTKDLYDKNDQNWSFPYPLNKTGPDNSGSSDTEARKKITLGERGYYGAHLSLPTTTTVIVTYGNGVSIALNGIHLCPEREYDTAVIDLRWVHPIEENWLRDLKHAKNVIILDECRKTGSLGEALVGDVVLRWNEFHPERPLPKIKLISAHDCFIPIGDGATLGLPSPQDVKNCLTEIHQVDQKFHSKSL
jgi:2-oxoisovalerate dehydrogenase E1 component